MKVKFNHIDYCLVDGSLIIFLSCNEDESLLAEVSLCKQRVMELYPEEFVTYRTKQYNNNAPYYIPDGECSFHEWYSEHMNKARAWRIFEAIGIDNFTFSTNE